MNNRLKMSDIISEKYNDNGCMSKILKTITNNQKNDSYYFF